MKQIWGIITDCETAFESYKSSKNKAQSPITVSSYA